MANSTHFTNISMAMTSLVKWFQANLLHPVGFIEVGAIGVNSFGLVLNLAAALGRFVQKQEGA